MDFGGVHASHFAGARQAVPLGGMRTQAVDDSAFLVCGDKKRNLEAVVDFGYLFLVAFGVAEVFARDEYAAYFVFDDELRCREEHHDHLCGLLAQGHRIP